MTILTFKQLGWESDQRFSFSHCNWYTATKIDNISILGNAKSLSVMEHRASDSPGMSLGLTTKIICLLLEYGLLSIHTLTQFKRICIELCLCKPLSAESEFMGNREYIFQSA